MVPKSEPIEVLRQLGRIVGSQHVLSTPEDLYAYSYDADPRYQNPPLAVAMPSSTAEIQELVRLARSYEVGLVPRGAATNLTGGTVPANGTIVVALARMNTIRDIDERNLTATVEPGVVTESLQNEVEKHGLFYPPDPGSKSVSTLGGNVAAGAGGLRGLKYGVTRDYVLALEVVAPSGEVLRTGSKAMKDVAGYDLTRLFVGSEGTLGIITEITLKLLPKPTVSRTLLATFGRLEDAAESVASIIAARIVPATLEFMDRETLTRVEEYSHVGLPTNAEAMLLIEQDGHSLAPVEGDVRHIREICKTAGATSVEVAATREAAEKLRHARAIALSALARAAPTTILEDATVPRSRMADFVREIRRIAAKHKVTICTFGHAGDGNLHPTCLTDIRNAEEMHRVEAAFDEVFDTALAMGGTITGEHGVGLSKAPVLGRKLGPTGIEIMKSIKRAIDPQGIMNPGKLFVP